MKLPYDRDWYPVKHTFKGESIKPSQVGECLKLTDWKKDKIFRISHLDRLTNLFRDDANEKSISLPNRVTDNLTIDSSRTPVTEKNYCITDYYKDMEQMFDAHMSSVMEQFKGKFTVLSSGGIDSHMIAAWMYKNKMNFDIVGLIQAPRHTKRSNHRVQLSIEQWKKIVPAKIIQVDSDLVVNDYLTNKFPGSVPKPTVNHMDGYDFRTLEIIRQDADWILHGGGSNHTMLHNAKGSLVAFNSFDTKWKFFSNTDVFKEVSYPCVAKTVYNEDLDISPFLEGNRYANAGWKDKPIRWLDFGAWVAYSRLYEDQDDKVITLKNKKWYDLWESIDWTKIDYALLHECLSASVWRKYIKKHTTPGIESVTKTTNNGSELYTPNQENEDACRSAWNHAKNRFKGNLPMLTEILSCEWLLDRYKKIHPWGLALCHLEKFLQN